MASKPRTVILKFDPELNDLGGGEVRGDLSLVVAAGDSLWLASDETTRIERLSRQSDGTYADHASFLLADFLDLPGGQDEEADIEGLSYEGDYLWIIGSHSLKRGKPEEDKSVEENLKELAEIEADGNRYLLARIPLINVDGTYRLLKTYEDPAGQGKKLTAARLKGDDKGGELMKALRDDPHIGPFLSIPSKDNGFDIEGLAVAQDRVFAGLRGPVLRGWAIILELRVKEDSAAKLTLKKIEGADRPYRKHFFDLRGLGVRELSVDGDDLLLLTGPTMGLDGPVEILRWKGGAAPDGESFVPYEQLEKVIDVPFGRGKDAGKDHAEGMAFLENGDGSRSLLVVYDAPSEQRMQGDSAFKADLFDVPPS